MQISNLRKNKKNHNQLQKFIPLEMSGTSQNEDLRQRVEADKRSILEQALKSFLMNDSYSTRQSNPTNKNNNNEPLTDTEYSSIFENEDVDDSEDVFKEILKKAEEAFAREKNIKKKNPFYKNTCYNFEMPSKRKRKRKPNAFEKSINLMNIFRQSLNEQQEQKKNPLGIVNENTEKNNAESLKNIDVPEKNQVLYKIYPAWQTTATFTPIFPVLTNPRWSKNQLSSKSSKTQTPDNRTNNWENNSTNAEVNNSSSHKNIRTNVTTCNLVVDNKNFTTPTANPINTSTPLRSTIVRFKPSPPEHITYSNYSSSSDSFSMEENEQKQRSTDDLKVQSLFFKKYKDKKYQNPPEMYQDKHVPEKQFEHKRNIIENYTDNISDNSKETNISLLNNRTQQPFFVEEFIRNLNYNISNNYDMEVKCSMKLKYFQ